MAFLAFSNNLSELSIDAGADDSPVSYRKPNDGARFDQIFSAVQPFPRLQRLWLASIYINGPSLTAFLATHQLQSLELHGTRLEQCEDPRAAFQSISKSVIHISRVRVSGMLSYPHKEINGTPRRLRMLHMHVCALDTVPSMQISYPPILAPSREQLELGDLRGVMNRRGDDAGVKVRIQFSLSQDLLKLHMVTWMT